MIDIFGQLLILVICFIIFRVFFNGKGGECKQIDKEKAEQNPQQFLSRIIDDLKRLLFQPKISYDDIKNILRSYESELGEKSEFEVAETVHSQSLPFPEQTTNVRTEEMEVHAPNVIAQWYKDNTISFLLYLGAFLIVIAGTTFLTFSWNSLNGWTRFLSFSAFTAVFGVVGAFLSTKPKVSQAGSTFLGIMAILLPLNGAAYQRFVLPSDSSISIVWILTSLLCIGVYVLIFRFFSNRFYATLLNMSSLSLVESFINLSNGSNSYYIFGGIISAFIVYLIGRNMTRFTHVPMKIVFDYESQTVLAISIIFGFVYLSLQGNIFTKEAVIAFFLSSLYYAMLYLYEQRVYFIPADLFLYAAIIFLGKWLDWTSLYFIILSFIFAYINVGLSFFLRQNKDYTKETSWSFSLSLFPVFVGFMTALFATGIEHLFIIETVMALTLGTFYTVFRYLYGEKNSFIAVDLLFLATIIFYGKWANWTDFVLMIACFGLAFLNLGISYSLRQIKAYQNEHLWSLSLSFFPAAAAVLFGVSYVQGMGDWYQWQLALAFYLLGAFFSFRYVIQKYPNDIGANISIFVATYILAAFYHTPPQAIAYIILVMGFVSLSVANLWKRQSAVQVPEFFSALFLGLIYSTFSVVYAQFNIQPHVLMTWLMLLWTSSFFFAYILHNRNPVYMFPFFLALSMAIYSVNTEYLQSLFPDIPSLSYSYLLTTAAVLFLYRDKSPLKYAFTFGMGLFTLYSYAFLYFNENLLYIMLLSFFHIYLGLYAATKYRNDFIIFIPQFFLYIFVYYLIVYLQAGDYLLFWLTFTAGIAYGFGAIANIYLKEKIRSRYTIFFAIAVLLFMVFISVFQPENEKSLISLSHVITIVLAAGYLTHYRYRFKPRYFGYIAAFIWLLGLEKFFQYLGITNHNYYYQPFTYYVFGVGLYHHLKSKPSALNLLLFGMISSILPLVFQSYGVEGIGYALYLAVESIIFIGVGISFVLQKVRYVGLIGLVLAIFIQTGQFIFSLPRWLLIGLLGLVIIIVATYLLSKKEERK